MLKDFTFLYVSPEEVVQFAFLFERERETYRCVGSMFSSMVKYFSNLLVFLSFVSFLEKSFLEFLYTALFERAE